MFSNLGGATLSMVARREFIVGRSTEQGVKKHPSRLITTDKRPAASLFTLQCWILGNQKHKGFFPGAQRRPRESCPFEGRKDTPEYPEIGSRKDSQFVAIPQVIVFRNRSIFPIFKVYNNEQKQDFYENILVYHVYQNANQKGNAKNCISPSSTDGSLKLDKFEINLIRLDLVSTKMQVIARSLPKISQRNNRYGLKSILREYTIVHLYNFIKIRQDLLEDFHKRKKDALDVCLRPFWEPIVRHERAIRELRNSYFAHLQEKNPLEKHIEDILFETGFPADWGDTIFFACCVWGYHEFVKANFREDYDRAHKKYYVLLPPVLPNYVFTERTVYDAMRFNKSQNKSDMI